jgi:hypothetical protein
LLPAGGERLSGEVVAYAASARVLQVRGADGREQQVSLAPNVVVRRADGTVTTAAELRAGERVLVVGRRGAQGTLIAEEVSLGRGS